MDEKLEYINEWSNEINKKLITKKRKRSENIEKKENLVELSDVFDLTEEQKRKSKDYLIQFMKNLRVNILI
jgi:hypothetical protein